MQLEAAQPSRASHFVPAQRRVAAPTRMLAGVRGRERATYLRTHEQMDRGRHPGPDRPHRDRHRCQHRAGFRNRPRRTGHRARRCRRGRGRRPRGHAVQARRRGVVVAQRFYHAHRTHRYLRRAGAGGFSAHVGDDSARRRPRPRSRRYDRAAQQPAPHRTGYRGHHLLVRCPARAPDRRQIPAPAHDPGGKGVGERSTLQTGCQYVTP